MASGASRRHITEDWAGKASGDHGGMEIVVRTRRDGLGRHWAWCPELPGCRATGPSASEAVAKLEPRIRGYLASLDRPVPGALKKVVVTA